ncbi:CBS domain-containing protein [Nocardia sp. CDC159]|uniref:CBS domain-containing protein n=1 Tax=Nocardia pulmonis TaxID=2951408 RepID=A0A9X2E848_9NOCA|nr:MULTISPECIES: CBS domain-containing protein [Nocardia]MCM6775325.1 CBS domain-containing protein [Nocardia pulmonis]MCM6787941.1 CBS domain-containing protein [Nocardia sp. CDC159]
MRISEVLRKKGAEVVTIAPDADVRALLATLAEHNVGAVVVSADGIGIDGIVSERDIVRRLHRFGADLLDRPVAEIMTAVVHTCSPDDRVDSLRATMTDHRIRHLPVVQDERMVGIVSIGDVVKSAISELQDEREHLVQYLHG